MVGSTPQRSEPARFFGRRPVRSPNEALQPEAAPPPPPIVPRPSRRNPMLSTISGFMSFLLVAFFVAGGLFVFEQRQVTAPGPLTADKVVYIAPRTEVVDIIDQLEKEKVIDSPLLFRLTLISEQKWSSVRFGEYLFKAHASMRDVMDTLVSGRQILHSVTVPEGLTSDQIVQRLKESEFLAGDLREQPREGVLLPETYRIARGMSRNELLRKMQDDQTKLVDQIWARRSPDVPLKSKYELITLASIVEKETGKSDERPRIAGVFLNRLQKRMRLQSDPTIVYGLVGGKGTLGRGILKSELDKATPYNTYIVEGLPPGPIANPGRAALEAVANPSRTKDLYFVADGTGGHAFAETLDQHLRNVTRWRQIEKEAKEKASAPANVDQVPAADIPTPAGSPPARDQRGQLLEPDPTFGALPRVIADSNAAVEAILAATGGAPVIRMESAPVIALDPRPNLLAFSGAKPAPPVRKGRGEAERPPLGTFANFNLGPGVENLTLAIASGPMAPALDGPIDAEENGAVDPAIVPMSAGRLSEMKARSAKFGPSGDDTLPLINEPIVSAYAPSDLTGRTASGAARILDASEGTALDPLRNKSWDLNSAKTVPTGISAAVR